MIVFGGSVIIPTMICPMTGKTDGGPYKILSLIKDLLRGAACGPIGMPKPPKQITAAIPQ
jgi:hypothetical protein